MKEKKCRPRVVEEPQRNSKDQGYTESKGQMGARGFTALGLVLLAPSAQGITLWHAGNVPAFTPPLPGRASPPDQVLECLSFKEVCGYEIDKVATPALPQMPDLKLHDFSNPVPFLRLPFGLPAQVLALCFVAVLPVHPLSSDCHGVRVQPAAHQPVDDAMEPIGGADPNPFLSLWVSLLVLARNPAFAFLLGNIAGQFLLHKSIDLRDLASMVNDHLKSVFKRAAGMAKNGAEEKLELLRAGTDCAANALAASMLHSLPDAARNRTKYLRATGRSTMMIVEKVKCAIGRTPLSFQHHVQATLHGLGALTAHTVHFAEVAASTTAPKLRAAQQRCADAYGMLQPAGVSATTTACSACASFWSACVDAVQNQAWPRLCRAAAVCFERGKDAATRARSGMKDTVVPACGAACGELAQTVRDTIWPAFLAAALASARQARHTFGQLRASVRGGWGRLSAGVGSVLSEYYVDLEPMNLGLVANATSGAFRSLRAVHAHVALSMQSLSRRVALTMETRWADSETEVRIKRLFVAAIPALFAVIGVYRRMLLS